MKARVMTTLLCCALAGAAGAQKSPSEVTDAQIRDYKAAAEASCVESGQNRGEGRERSAQFCKCMTGVFEKSMTRAEWQQVFFFSTQGRAAEEANVLGPHVGKVRVCAMPR